METDSAQLKPSEKETIQTRKNFKSDVVLSSVVTEVRENRVPGIRDSCHLSLDNLGFLWVSDHLGNLVQTQIRQSKNSLKQETGNHSAYTPLASMGIYMWG